MGFSWKHILYLIVMMTIGAALLDAIINGGLAALMYHDQVRPPTAHAPHCDRSDEFHFFYFFLFIKIDDDIFFCSALLESLTSLCFVAYTKGNIRVWEWPNTLGGDIIITTLLTGLLTWLIASNLVMRYAPHSPD
jgi:hypothetical protein